MIVWFVPSIIFAFFINTRVLNVNRRKWNDNNPEIKSIKKVKNSKFEWDINLFYFNLQENKGKTILIFFYSVPACRKQKECVRGKNQISCCELSSYVFLYSSCMEGTHMYAYVHVHLLKYPCSGVLLFSIYFFSNYSSSTRILVRKLSISENKIGLRVSSLRMFLNI